MCEPPLPHGINNEVNRVDRSAVWDTLEESNGTQNSDRLASGGGALN